MQECKTYDAQYKVLPTLISSPPSGGTSRYGKQVSRDRIVITVKLSHYRNAGDKGDRKYSSRFPAEAKIVPLGSGSRAALRPTQPPATGYQGSFPSGIGRLAYDADQSPPSSADVKLY
jgi:hypothetical protein